MAKYYKMVVSTTYSKVVIVKANSLEEAKEAEEKVLNNVDLMDDDNPDIDVKTYEVFDYDDSDVDFDVSKAPKFKYRDILKNDEGIIVYVVDYKDGQYYIDYGDSLFNVICQKHIEKFYHKIGEVSDDVMKEISKYWDKFA